MCGSQWRVALPSSDSDNNELAADIRSLFSILRVLASTVFSYSTSSTPLLLPVVWGLGMEENKVIVAQNERYKSMNAHLGPNFSVYGSNPSCSLLPLWKAIEMNIQTFSATNSTAAVTHGAQTLNAGVVKSFATHNDWNVSGTCLITSHT